MNTFDFLNMNNLKLFYMFYVHVYYILFYDYYQDNTNKIGT